MQIIKFIQNIKERKQLGNQLSRLGLDSNGRPEFYLRRSEVVRGARNIIGANLRLDGVCPIPSTKMSTARDFT